MWRGSFAPCVALLRKHWSLAAGDDPAERGDVTDADHDRPSPAPPASGRGELGLPIASPAKALARLTSPVHRDRMTDRPVAPSILRESNLLDALREGARAIRRGEFLTHDQMIADVARWKQSRRAAR